MADVIPMLSAWRAAVASDNLPREPEYTETVCVNGICADKAGVYAYAGHVAIECDDGRELVDAHLPLDAARALHAALEQAIADAERIAGTVQIGGGRDRTFRVGGGVSLRDLVP